MDKTNIVKKLLKNPRKKDDERARSRANRVQFKHLLEELNTCVSQTKLSHNNTLELTVATMKLNTFYEQDAGSSTSLMLDDGPMSMCSYSSLGMPSLLPVDNFLKVSNAFGIGFLQSGMIVYATDQLVKYFIDVEYLVGYQLSKICFNSKQVLKTVFEDNMNEFVLEMKGNYGSTTSNDVCISGKIMYSNKREAMFLGYSKIKPFALFKNPSLAVTGCNVVLKACNLEVMKAHPFVEYMLNTKLTGTDGLMYPHPDDMMIIPGILSQLKETGFSESNNRFIRTEDDGTTKYVHCLLKMSLVKDHKSGVTKICSLVWPYGVSYLGECFSGDDFKMIQNNPKLNAGFKEQSSLYKKAVLNGEGIFANNNLPITMGVKKGPLRIVERRLSDLHAIPQSSPPKQQILNVRKDSAFSRVTPNSNFLTERKSNGFL